MVSHSFTRFNRGLRASARVRNFLKDLIAEKRMELKKGADPHQDLITCLLSTRDENNGEGMTEKEIVDNVILVLTAGHDNSAILITFMIRLLAIEPSIYAAVLQEQEGIAKSKPRGELLTWEDLAKMKYTWKVALETLRMFPPIFGGFRKAVKDIEYNGYIIPKGWQIFWTMNMTLMDDSIFTEPSKFNPTRFDNQASIPPYSFIAFGGGPRMCPGYEFAKIEALVTIHYLVKRGLELAQKSSDPRQDLISCMLSTRDENKREVITEKGIEDNAILNGIHDVFFYSATDNLYRKSEQHKQQQYAKQF
uniref:Cytochrome P450 716B1-like n=1 Tax=Populus alba TaxID=43335 RepID=A0A4U5QUV5_POPAL|nr:cytochrome P450 716B1-like [Populus alba]